MRETTLCYIEKNNEYLMLHRNKKKNDANEGMWIGVGGKKEKGESNTDCLLREVKEETGLTLTDYEAKGIIFFHSDCWEDEVMYLFKGYDYSGELTDDCDEGELKWIPKAELEKLAMWEGDRIFFELMEGDFFFLRLYYKGYDLDSFRTGGIDFKEKVYEAVGRIPKGMAATYGEVAAMAGYPGAARAVGNALHVNPYEGVVPCHRVVNSKGYLAEKFGFGGAEDQARRLESEGIRVLDDANGGLYVDLKQLYELSGRTGANE